MEYPEIIKVTIPYEGKEYDSEIYTDPKDCYLARALKLLGYENINISPSFAEIGIYMYQIEDGLDTARVRLALKNKQDIHVKLIKLWSTT
jgi:hypothetical protein